MSTSFAHLGLPDPLVRALSKQGITEPFPIQMAAIPDVLAGRDLSGKAPTGSGKTLAFGLPLLARIEQGSRHQPRALLLAPTRELAEQIKRELVPLARAVGRSVAAIYGGVSYGPQKAAMRKGVDVLVATPGRLEDLIEQGSIDLRRIDIAVIDEADRMADMGFMPAVRRILDATPRARQTLLFSATLDADVAVLSRDYQRDPTSHEAGSIEPETSEARHHFWEVRPDERVRHTAEIVRATGRSIVFTRTRRGADRLAKRLRTEGVEAVAMHGGRSQGQRSRALQAFASGRTHALVATDVAARGIHVDSVESVIHFDPPADHKDYLHRSGRTARAGASGSVVSLVTGDKKKAAQRLQRDLGISGGLDDPRPDTLHSGGRLISPPASVPAGSRSVRSSNRPADQRRSGRGGAPGDTQSIYVANLPWQTQEDGVRRLFGTHGEVFDVAIITDRRSGRSRGFGFVEMAATAAPTAIEALHGTELDGRDLTVRAARPRSGNGRR